MNYDRLKKQLVVHEGLELKPYKCTANKTTIGVGRNIEEVGISEDEAMYLLENDIKNVVAQCQATFSWFDGLTDIRKEAIVNLVFNMGLSTFCKFKNTIIRLNVLRNTSSHLVIFFGFFLYEIYNIVNGNSSY